MAILFDWYENPDGDKSLLPVIRRHIQSIATALNG